MAEANILLSQDQYSCSVCLDILEDPIALPCGHQVCRMCISGCWHLENQKGVYRCPQCKLQSFPQRHVGRNTAVDDIVEKLKETRLQATSPAFCETHLQPHYKSPAFKKHKLVEASRRLQEQICSQHDKLLEVYCRTDQQCICMLCMLDDHEGHDTVSAAAGRAEKQKQLLQMQENSKQSIQKRAKEIQKLKTAVVSYKHSTQTAIKESDRIFNELIKCMETRHHELTQLIKDQEKAAEGRAEKIIKELEQEIAKLRRRNTQMQDLSETKNPVQFLQSFQSVSAVSGFADFRPITHSSSFGFKEELKTLSQLREELETFFNNELRKIANQDAPFSFAHDSLSTFTFADLAKKSRGSSFRIKDPCFSWPNAGTTVFSTKATASQNEDEDDKSKLKSGDQAQKMIFKQIVKLFKWDHGLCQWKGHGDGELKILFHSEKNYYQALIRHDQISKVYVNHIITKDIKLTPLNKSANTLVWTANNYTDGDIKVEQLAAKFKTPEFAESFKKVFTECQRKNINL